MSNNIFKRLLFATLIGGFVCHNRIVTCEKRSISYLKPPSPKTFSFWCQNQMVKVDSNIYYLDRLRSSLKSNYFEKLFTSGDFKEKNYNVLEIHPKNVEMFPSVIDLIHGRKKLIHVLNKDIYLPLLETMDHLEMEIDLETVGSFINKRLKSYSPEDAKIFKLYNFILKNNKFEYLFDNVFEYFSKHLTTVQNHKTFSTLPLNHLIRIIRSIKKVDDKKRYQVIQICTKWLCCDVESRLPRLVILINSIKPWFHSEKESNVDNSTVPHCSLQKSNADERVHRKSIAKCVFALLAHGGKLNPTLLRREDISAGYFGLPEWYTYERDVQERREKYDEYDEYENEYENESPATLVNTINEYDKLRKFLENGSFHDITVRVGEKVYKLHRAVLESRCGYFADIFRTEYAEAIAKSDELPTSPSAREEYVLDVVDQSTFDAMIDYIYFDKNIRWKFNDTVRVFKIADILKIDSLLVIMKGWLNDSNGKVNSSEVAEVLKCSYGKMQHEDLHSLCLSKHLSTKWPEIDNMSQFCSISWPMLKTVLKSPYFRPDDPRKILDICSTWIIHDVEKRYRHLRRIAQILNPISVADEDKYETEAVELADQSVQSVRDRLWEILSTIPYLVHSEDLSNNRTKKTQEIPTFISTKQENDIVNIGILNSDMDQIASFVATLPKPRCLFDYIQMSATMINNNLFTLTFYRHSYASYGKFLVYNLSLKKTFVLPFVDHSQIYISLPYTLLNCNNEIYCCSSSDNTISKFSMQLNRWMVISKRKSNKKLPVCRYTSDGEMFYRLCTSYEVGYHVVEAYDFEKNEWFERACSPRNTLPEFIEHLTFINKRDLAISKSSKIILFNRESKSWRNYSLPSNISSKGDSPLLVQCEDRMLVLIDKKLYTFSPSNGSWELKKEFLCTYNSPGELNFQKFAVIHRPTTRVDE